MKEKKILPLIFGIEGTKLTEAEIELFHEHPIRGIILFARNIESEEQLKALNKSIKDLYHDREIPIFVDQEGGRVARIRPPIAKQKYPTGEYFDQLYKKAPDKALAEIYDNYFQIMDEAAGLGFDSLCAPVCDLRHEGASDVIGDRSFGNDPQQVIELASMAVKGILDAGGIPLIKHVPGHGRALLDSHYDLPYVETTLAELTATDFIPFKALQSPDVWGMTAHIVYKSLDQTAPVTLSKKAIGYIRANIFDGVLVTDDVGMFALHGEVGAKKALLKRVTAAVSKENASKGNVSKENANENSDSNDAVTAKNNGKQNGAGQYNTDQYNTDQYSLEQGIVGEDIAGPGKTRDAAIDEKTQRNDWTCKYGDQFAQMFDVAICDLPSMDVLQFCQREEEKIHQEFLHSLALVSKLSIDAGCDYVLHCSGKIDEMHSISSAFDITFT